MVTFPEPNVQSAVTKGVYVACRCFVALNVSDNPMPPALTLRLSFYPSSISSHEVHSFALYNEWTVDSLRLSLSLSLSLSLPWLHAPLKSFKMRQIVASCV